MATPFELEFELDPHVLIEEQEEGLQFDHPATTDSKTNYRKKYYAMNRAKIIDQNSKSRLYKYHTDPEYRKKCIDQAKANYIKKVDPVKLKMKKELADLYEYLHVLKDKYNADVLETNDKIAKMKMSMRKIPRHLYEEEQEQPHDESTSDSAESNTVG
jgi:hypothetical protein